MKGQKIGWDLSYVDSATLELRACIIYSSDDVAIVNVSNADLIGFERLKKP